jgi:branched-chain amino acid transport system ATP-binding protein
MSKPLLSVEQLSASYGDVTVLRGVTLEVNVGQIVALIGANGAGKTTLLKTISGLVKPTGGSIQLDGESIYESPTHRIVEAGFVQSPEGKQLFPDMSVLENLLIGAHNSNARARRDKTLEEVFELFPILKERSKQRAGTLSGGQQQMVAVGRALMAKPKVLALDEPSLGLAPILVDRLFEAIKQIRALGISILVIEQNVQKVLQMADFGYVLETGRIEMSGIGPELLKNERLRASYLGI